MIDARECSGNVPFHTFYVPLCILSDSISYGGALVAFGPAPGNPP